MNDRSDTDLRMHRAYPDQMGFVGREEEEPSTARAGCIVVMYHYVGDREPIPDPRSPGRTGGVRGLDSAQFSAQLDRMAASREPIDWPTLYAHLQGNRNLPERSFMLTFDDGLADHANTVVPILQSRGLRGTFFVPGEILTNSRLLSAHAVHLLLGVLNERELEDEIRRYLCDHAGGSDALRTFDNALAPENAQALGMYDYESAGRARLKYALTMQLPPKIRNEAIEEAFERHVGSSARWARHWYMTWDDLSRLQTLGHTIGGHGFSHEPMARLTPEHRMRDVLRSGAVLREGLGADIRPFSYPFGIVTGDGDRCCRQAGFAHAFTTESRPVIPSDKPFRLPRIDTIHVESMLTEDTACHQI